MTAETRTRATAPTGAAAARTAAPGADTTPWLTAEQQRAWRAYLSGTARVAEALTRQLDQDCGLSLSEYEILVRLSEVPDRTLRMSELASSLVHSRSRLTHTVTRLERRGVVRRENCLVDGRGVNCVMTDDGYALLVEAAPGHVRAVRANLVELLSDEQMVALGAAMERLAAGPDDA
ncbi:MULTISPECIES: MarR family winged helix-turn-helix transcriptional regulator [unclassified Actinotalea]|uniref:MarR family winged helix-turn-helix transcriptional regulator n=1 Tax=unclassified Actinotalea TaxID=2638618 RepID=UPI0015F6CEAB|nr:MULTISPECIES: MarR family transcriptional regulator [unclassified Actinotalea]